MTFDNTLFSDNDYSSSSWNDWTYCLVPSTRVMMFSMWSDTFVIPIRSSEFGFLKNGWKSPLSYLHNSRSNRPPYTSRNRPVHT